MRTVKGVRTATAKTCHRVARERLRVRVVPKPLPMPEVPRLLEELVVRTSGRRLPAVVLLVATRPRVGLVPLVPRRPLVDGGASLLAVCSSSRRLRSSSRRRSSSAALRSAARCFSRASASCSARSSERPFQPGLRISRWLCSVCERILVHVFNRLDALATVWATTWGSHNPISMRQFYKK